MLSTMCDKKKPDIIGENDKNMGKAVKQKQKCQ